MGMPPPPTSGGSGGYSFQTMNATPWRTGNETGGAPDANYGRWLQDQQMMQRMNPRFLISEVPSIAGGDSSKYSRDNPNYVQNGGFGGGGYGGGTAISGSGAPAGGAGGGMGMGGAGGTGAVPAAPDAAYKRYLDLLMNPGQAFQNPEYQAILQQGTDALGKSAANSRMRFAGKTAADFQTLGQRTAANYLGQISGQLGGAAQEERARYGADLTANNQGFNQTLSAWNAQQAAAQADYARRLSEWSNYTGIQAR